MLFNFKFNLNLRFCQFVTNRNQIERLIYCNILKNFRETFDDCIFIDESTIELNKLGRYRWHKNYSNESGKHGVYSHPESVHVLAGISRKGATGIVIFKGKMKAFDFQNLFSLEIMTFINENYPNGHRLIMDSPTHSANSTKTHLINSNINHFETPAQSPVINLKK